MNISEVSDAEYACSIKNKIYIWFRNLTLEDRNNQIIKLSDCKRNFAIYDIKHIRLACEELIKEGKLIQSNARVVSFKLNENLLKNEEAFEHIEDSALEKIKFKKVKRIKNVVHISSDENPKLESGLLKRKKNGSSNLNLFDDDFLDQIGLKSKARTEQLLESTKDLI
jgi:hypothetical protein